MYLLDTAIVAALRKAKWDADHAPLAQWVRRIPAANLFVSAITVLELENGVTQLRSRDAEGGASLREWLDRQVYKVFDGRILSVDAAVVRRRSLLHYSEGRDGLIAATALEHGLMLVTRRPSAYRSGRVKLLNPYEAMAESAEPESAAEWQPETASGPGWLRNLFLRF